MARLYFKISLNRDIENNILNRIYTFEELRDIYNTLRNDYNDRMVDFKRAVVICKITFIVLSLLTIRELGLKEVTFFMLVITIVVLFLALIIIAKYSIYRSNEQFNKAVSKSYPEYGDILKL